VTGFGRRVASGVGTLALLAAVVVSTGVIGEQRLSTDERYREFTVTGETGTWVSTDTFHVEVRSTQAAGVVADQSGWQYQTSGVWLLVEVRLVARTEPTTIGYAAVRDDRGRTWRATDRLEQPLLHWSYPLQPGLPVAATLVFEVPTDAASSLTLRLSERADPRMRLVVQIPLRVPATQVTAALADPEPTVVEPPRLVGEDVDHPGWRP